MSSLRSRLWGAAFATPALDALSPAARSNFTHLQLDIVWYGVLSGSIIAFLQIYAVRIGANVFQVALLSSAPALVNVLLGLQAGHWLANKPLNRITFVTALWHRAGYLLLVPLPWLLAPAAEAWALPLLVLLMSVPGTVLAVAFNAMFADVVPPEWRGHVVGRRNMLLALSQGITAISCGLIADRVAFPASYQLLFALGTVAAALSTYHLGRITLPAVLPPRVGRLLNAEQPGLLRFFEGSRLGEGLRFLTRGGGQQLLRSDLLRGPYGRFMAVYLLFYTCLNVSIPIFPLFYVNGLHLSDGDISVGRGIYFATMFFGSLGVQRLSARFGHRGVLAAVAVMYADYPLLLSFSQGPALYWTACLIHGVVVGIGSAAVLNRLMERVPEDDRPAHMAMHNVVLNLGTLLGAGLAPLAVQFLGLRWALGLGGALRIVAGLALMLAG